MDLGELSLILTMNIKRETLAGTPLMKRNGELFIIYRGESRISIYISTWNGKTLLSLDNKIPLNRVFVLSIIQQHKPRPKIIIGIDGKVIAEVNLNGYMSTYDRFEGAPDCLIKTAIYGGVLPYSVLMNQLNTLHEKLGDYTYPLPFSANVYNNQNNKKYYYLDRTNKLGVDGSRVIRLG